LYVVQQPISPPQPSDGKPFKPFEGFVQGTLFYQMFHKDRN